MRIAIQVVSKQGIKGPDITINLVWTNTACLGMQWYAMHNSAGIFEGN